MSKDKCRVCLINKGQMIDIFKEPQSSMISTKIMSLAKIKIHPEDGLPKTICRKCVKKLNICIEFVVLCQDSDSKLRSLLDDSDTKETLSEHDLQCDSYNEELMTKKDITIDLPIEDNTVHSYSKEILIPVKNEFDKNDWFDVKNSNEKKNKKQQCFTCGKVMSSGFRLKTHLRTHTGERPFTCPHCHKNFSLEQSLKVHLRIHTGEKPLSCTICGTKFAHTAGLAAHKLKHTGQTPYHCVLCPRSFRTIGHLQYHIRRHTGEKKFECNTCTRAFITRSDLKQHLVSHSGDKPHVCSICGLRLTRASHLKRHVQFIHKENSLVCNECPSKFVQKEDLEKHKKKHENTLEKT